VLCIPYEWVAGRRGSTYLNTPAAHTFARNARQCAYLPLPHSEWVLAPVVRLVHTLRCNIPGSRIAQAAREGVGAECEAEPQVCSLWGEERGWAHGSLELRLAATPTAPHTERNLTLELYAVMGGHDWSWRPQTRTGEREQHLLRRVLLLQPVHTE